MERVGRTSRAQRSAQIRSKWAAHVAAWRDSGRRQSEYCRERGLDPKYFSIWKGRVERAPTLVPVVVRARAAGPEMAATAMTTDELTVSATLANGIALNVHLPSARTLSLVLTELARLPC